MSSYVIINALGKMTVVRTVPLTEIDCNYSLTHLLSLFVLKAISYFTVLYLSSQLVFLKY